MDHIIIRKSDREDKKLISLIPIYDNGNIKHIKIYFGAPGYTDFINKSNKATKVHNRPAEETKELYLNRHKKNENWTIDGLFTPGFWSRWILWNKPTLKGSIRDLSNRFGIRIKLIH